MTPAEGAAEATGAGTALVTRLSTALTADPARVLARLFVPGHDVGCFQEIGV